MATAVVGLRNPKACKAYNVTCRIVILHPWSAYVYSNACRCLSFLRRAFDWVSCLPSRLPLYSSVSRAINSLEGSEQRSFMIFGTLSLPRTVVISSYSIQSNRCGPLQNKRQLLHILDDASHFNIQRVTCYFHFTFDFLRISSHKCMRFLGDSSTHCNSKLQIILNSIVNFPVCVSHSPTSPFRLKQFWWKRQIKTSTTKRQERKFQNAVFKHWLPHKCTHWAFSAFLLFSVVVTYTRTQSLHCNENRKKRSMCLCRKAQHSTLYIAHGTAHTHKHQQYYFNIFYTQ